MSGWMILSICLAAGLYVLAGIILMMIESTLSGDGNLWGIIITWPLELLRMFGILG